jgi:hypothetical protein
MTLLHLDRLPVAITTHERVQMIVGDDGDNLNAAGPRRLDIQNGAVIVAGAVGWETMALGRGTGFRWVAAERASHQSEGTVEFGRHFVNRADERARTASDHRQAKRVRRHSAACARTTGR